MLRRAWRRFRPQRSLGAALGGDKAALHALLLQKTPGAVRAQRQMDEHPQGFHTDKSRLFELIDFNDTFVNLVLALSPNERSGFLPRLQAEMTAYCRQAGAPMFSEEQFEAITRGLSKEVAVYLSARREGFGAEMTSRSQDAMGVDMVITDPVTGRSLNIDCKTPSSYHYRVKDLVQQGRLSQADGRVAEELGYVHEINGHGSDAVAVTILRIDPNELGEIIDFQFEKPELLAGRLRAIFRATKKY